MEVNRWLLQMLEPPIWSIGNSDVRCGEDLSYLLPHPAKEAGLQLHSINYGYDPYFLHDKKGHLLYEWKHLPSIFEVERVCRQFLKGNELPQDDSRLL